MGVGVRRRSLAAAVRTAFEPVASMFEIEVGARWVIGRPTSAYSLGSVPANFDRFFFTCGLFERGYTVPESVAHAGVRYASVRDADVADARSSDGVTGDGVAGDEDACVSDASDEDAMRLFGRGTLLHLVDYANVMSYDLASHGIRNASEIFGEYPAYWDVDRDEDDVMASYGLDRYMLGSMIDAMRPMRFLKFSVSAPAGGRFATPHSAREVLAVRARRDFYDEMLRRDLEVEAYLNVPAGDSMVPG